MTPVDTTVKPGWKSTEFWLSLIATVLPVIAPAFENVPTVAKVIGFVISVLAALGYTASRTLLKKEVL